MMKKAILFIITLAAVVILNNCSSNPTISGNDENNPFTGIIVRTAEGVSRQAVTDMSSEHMDSLVRGNINFAFDMYEHLAALTENQGKNVFFSPYSISIALAMTLAGAEGETEKEMHSALRFALAEPDLHRAFNKLDMEMESAAKQQDNVTLSVVNSLWGEYTWPFRLSFLNTLAEQYGAGMNVVDFIGAPDPSRILINNWVEKQTQSKIKNLLPPESVDDNTHLVLTNSIYFLADWQKKFNSEYTKDKTFTKADGSTVTAIQMAMAGNDTNVTLLYAENESKTIKAIELPYAGNRFSMVAVMPVDDDFAKFEENFTAQEYYKIITGLDSTKLQMSLPRFSFGTPSVSLKEPLKNMGMKLAFDVSADFSGIDGTKLLYVDNVYHKAFIEVNEQGTEASAATCVVLNFKGIGSNPKFLANRPFIYLIRDKVTCAVIFMGRVMDPTDKGEL
jgi:serpin B